MAADIFTWLVRVGDAGAIKFRTRSAEFGDGYRQVVGDGINGKSASWPITIIAPLDEMQAITDFLDRHGGNVPLSGRRLTVQQRFSRATATGLNERPAA